MMEISRRISTALFQHLKSLMRILWALGSAVPLGCPQEVEGGLAQHNVCSGPLLSVPGAFRR